MQRVGILTRLQKGSSILCTGDPDQQLIVAGAIWIYEELQFLGIDEQYGVIPGELPRLAIGGPSTTNERNVTLDVIGPIFLVRAILSPDATNP